MSDDQKVNDAILQSEMRITQHINTKYLVLDTRVTKLEDTVDGDHKGNIGLKTRVDLVENSQIHQGASQRWHGIILVAIFAIELLGFALMVWLYSLPVRH